MRNCEKCWEWAAPAGGGVAGLPLNGHYLDRIAGGFWDEGFLGLKAKTFTGSQNLYTFTEAKTFTEAETFMEAKIHSEAKTFMDSSSLACGPKGRLHTRTSLIRK